MAPPGPTPPPGRPDPWRAGRIAAFHITHVDNLASMAACGELRCDRACADDAELKPVNIAYETLKEKRSAWPVTLAKGGTLADYVPFYFAPRSPMLYVISRGGVAGYAGGQVEVAHLVFEADAIARHGEFVLTDGHAIAALTTHYDDLARVDEIDWAVMNDHYWSDTDEDGDRKRRRQAEFLVHRSVPFAAVRQIGVMNNTIAERVRAEIAGADHQPEVVIRGNWYY